MTVAIQASKKISYLVIISCMRTKKVKFVAHESKDKVSGLLMMPRQAEAILVLGHGAGAGMHHENMENIAGELAKLKIGTFRYQFPFMERGGGRDSEAVSLATVNQAILKASELVDDLPLFAGGHSFGGRMTSLAAASPDFPTDVNGLIFFAFPLHAPNKPSDTRAAHLKSIKIPMLFLSGTRDALASLDLLQPVVKKLKRKAKIHLLDTANHGYKILKRTRKSEEDVFAEMARVAKQWIGGK